MSNAGAQHDAERAERENVTVDGIHAFERILKKETRIHVTALSYPPTSHAGTALGATGANRPITKLPGIRFAGHQAFSLVCILEDLIQEKTKTACLIPKEVKPAIIGILVITITAFIWHRSGSAQIEHKSTSKAGSMSANASCYEKSTGRLVGSNKSVTSVLTSPDGIYRAYAESEAVASQSPNAASPECQNTSRLFVSDPKSDNFRPVLVVKPSPEALGNSIDLVDWSPSGNRLLLAQGVWQWGSDAGGIMLRIYDAESEKLLRESFVDEAFSKYAGKKCAGVFYPVGFSSRGQVVLTAGPFFEEGKDKPVEDSCVQQRGFWLIDTSIPAVTQLPDNYRVERYGKVLP